MLLRFCIYQTRGIIRLTFFVIGTLNIPFTSHFLLARAEISAAESLLRGHYEIKSKLSSAPFEEYRSFRENWISNCRCCEGEYKRSARKGRNGIFRLAILQKGTDDAEMSGRLAALPLTSDGSVHAALSVATTNSDSFACWQGLFGLATCPRHYLPSTPHMRATPPIICRVIFN